ncbi:MAG TPA: hypothetical protein PKY82_28945, partial [Pyrinomonadaceae bacterium]|nr:hypothetical protein [Pyrinomonadaceae bacterium]
MNSILMDSPPNLEALFSAALELPTAKRQKFLKENCCDDSAIIDEINQLLATHEQMRSSDFL